MGSNSASILPDDYKFKGDGSDSHSRWREVKDQVLNKSMSHHGFKMSLLDEAYRIKLSWLGDSWRSGKRSFIRTPKTFVSFSSNFSFFFNNWILMLAVTSPLEFL